MKSIFEPAVKKEVMERLNRLTPQTKANWGKMNAAQMLAHCAKGMQVPIGELALKLTYIRHIGRFFKSLAINDKPFTKNSPTAPEFIVSDDRDFNAEKNNFITAFNKISDGEHAIVVQEHGFFGPMTPTEWGIFLHKHLDHHFKQFGV